MTEAELDESEVSLKEGCSRLRDARLYHSLPRQPSLCDYAAFVPLAIVKFFRRLTSAFGWRYVVLVGAVYGVNQGLAEGWAFLADRYLKSDALPLGLALTPSQFAAVSGLTNVPWQIKAIYGLFSDTLPIRGMHRSPYIIMATVLGAIVFPLLAVLPLSFISYAFLFLLANYSIASPDVMIDASVARRSRSHAYVASDLQTLCWCMLGIGKMVASSSAGGLYTVIGSRGLFLLCTLTALVVLVPASLGWLGEPTSSPHRRLTDCRPLKQAFQKRVQRPLFVLALLVVALSVSTGLCANLIENDLYVALGGVCVSIVLVTAVYLLERGIDPRLAKASMYIFLIGAVQPSTEVLFYWYKETEDNCGGAYGPRPCFSAPFVGLLSTVSAVFFVVGTAIYNRWMSTWSYKWIWASTQLLLVGVNLLDLVWVQRLNLRVGVSDKLFILGEEVLGPLVSRWNTMPIFVLAARLCPPGTEATIFAMNMGLSNFGGTMGRYVGMGILHILGGVTAPEFNGLSTLVVIRSLSRLLPLLLIPFLIPNGSPADDDIVSANDAGEEQTDIRHARHQAKDDFDIQLDAPAIGGSVSKTAQPQEPEPVSNPFHSALLGEEVDVGNENKTKTVMDGF